MNKKFKMFSLFNINSVTSLCPSSKLPQFKPKCLSGELWEDLFNHVSPSRREKYCFIPNSSSSSDSAFSNTTLSRAELFCLKRQCLHTNAQNQ